MSEMTTSIGDYTVSMTGSGSTITFYVTAVQNKSIDTVTGTWTRP